MKPSEGQFIIDLPALIGEAVTSEVKVWPVYGRDKPLDRNTVLTSSETTVCMRNLLLSKLAHKAPGVVKDDRFRKNWGFAQRGHALEAWVVYQLLAFFEPGKELRFAGDDQVSFVKEGLSGTPDGLLTLLDGDGNEILVLLEIKSVDPRTRLGPEPKPKHMEQVQQNMGLLLDNGFDVHTAVVLYVDASNYQMMQQYIVPFYPAMYKAAKARGLTLHNALAVAGAEMEQAGKDKAWQALLESAAAHTEPEGLSNDSDDCTYCQFTEECSLMQVRKREERKNAPKMPEFVASRSAVALVNKYAAIKREEKELGELKDEVASKLKDALKDSDNRIETASFIATLTEVAGRKTLDVGSYAKATGVSPDPYYKTGKPSERLEVKERKDD